MALSKKGPHMEEGLKLKRMLPGTLILLKTRETHRVFSLFSKEAFNAKFTL